MDKQFEKGPELPSKKETKQIVEQYLAKVEPDLWDKLQNQWIDSHDETIVVDGKNVTITGMKYKCYIPTEKTYAWVIVGSNGQIITFERGIRWSNQMSTRLTEKWLHDNWIMERDR